MAEAGEGEGGVADATDPEFSLPEMVAGEGYAGGEARGWAIPQVRSMSDQGSSRWAAA